MASGSRTIARDHNWQREMDALHQRTQALHLFEFWSVGDGTEHEAVQKLQQFDKAAPYHWKFSDILPCLEKAGELIDMSDSERRSLIMCNPALHGQIAGMHQR